MSGFVLNEQDRRWLREMFIWWNSSERRRRHERKSRFVGATASNKPCKDYWIVDIRGGTAVSNGGEFKLQINVDNNGVHTVEVTISYDDSVADVQEALEAIEELIHEESLICDVIGAGEFPVNSIVIANKNAKSPVITGIFTRISDSTLNNGAYPHVMKMTPIQED